MNACLFSTSRLHVFVSSHFFASAGDEFKMHVKKQKLWISTFFCCFLVKFFVVVSKLKNDNHRKLF